MNNINFNEVTTVEDLLNANKNVKTPLETVIEGLSECGAKESKLVILFLLKNMMDWHHDVAEGDDVDKQTACAWAFDEGKLWSAIELVKSINVGDEE